MYFFEKVSNSFAAKVSSTLNLDKDREEIIAYGSYNLLQTLWSILALQFSALYLIHCCQY